MSAEFLNQGKLCPKTDLYFIQSPQLGHEIQKKKNVILNIQQLPVRLKLKAQK